MDTLEAAREQMRRLDIGGWLIADFRGSNLVFSEVFGPRHTTRRAFYWIPVRSEPVLLVHLVDGSSFPEPHREYATREQLVATLRRLVGPQRRIAMEYSPMGALPAISFVDAGMIELIRSYGVDVVSSAEVHQFTFARWPEGGLESHQRTAGELVRIVRAAFDHAGRQLGQVDEYGVQQFILQAFDRAGLNTYAPPIVAVNAHSGNPHYTPGPAGSSPINAGDWLLIDLWAREGTSMYGDITWVGYAGSNPPDAAQDVFAAVTGARDAALAAIRRDFGRAEPLLGWQVDQVARRYLNERGYGAYFRHRLGHSLGRQVHAGGVNLDGYETYDTRPLIPGIGITIEPGVYLPEFGVRSEIDVYLSEQGPVCTTEAQTEIIRFGV